MTEMVEVQRLPLTEEQALTVRTLSKAVNDHQARFGQIALGIERLRAQIEAAISQQQGEGEAVKARLAESTQALQDFSSRLAEEFEIDLSEGQWTLSVDEGFFIQTKRPEDISAGRKAKTAPRGKKKSVKRPAAKKAAKRTRSARK